MNIFLTLHLLSVVFLGLIGLKALRAVFTKVGDSYLEVAERDIVVSTLVVSMTGFFLAIAQNSSLAIVCQKLGVYVFLVSCVLGMVVIKKRNRAVWSNSTLLIRSTFLMVWLLVGLGIFVGV